MADTYWAVREGARWDVYSKQRGWMAHADTEDDARLILAGLEALQAQQPAAAVPDMATIRGAVARGWCHKATEDREMDVTLAECIAIEVRAMLAAAARKGE